MEGSGMATGNPSNFLQKEKTVFLDKIINCQDVTCSVHD